MAVYRPRKRRRWIWVLGVLAIAALGLFLWKRRRLQPSEEPREALTRMQEILEVLVLSHYTQEVVSGGRILREEEYTAALQDLKALEALWPRVQPLFKPAERTAFQAAFARLQELIRAKAPPEEVGNIACVLLLQLGGSCPKSLQDAIFPP